MVAVAVPVPLAVRVAEPSDVPEPQAPSKKVTVPVGVRAVLVTVAVRVTGLPKADGFGDVVSDSVVGTWPLTVCVNEPVLAPKLDELGP
jgi:hypothetical protein